MISLSFQTIWVLNLTKIGIFYIKLASVESLHLSQLTKAKSKLIFSKKMETKEIVELHIGIC